MPDQPLTPEHLRSARRRTLTAAYSYQGAAAAQIINLAEDAHALTDQLRAGLTPHALLDRTVTLTDQLDRALGDFPAQITKELRPAVYAAAEDLDAAAGRLRTNAPAHMRDSAHVNAAHRLMRLTARNIRAASH